MFEHKQRAAEVQQQQLSMCGPFGSHVAQLPAALPSASPNNPLARGKYAGLGCGLGYSTTRKQVGRIAQSQQPLMTTGRQL
jgi:hypothetical protein